jgi:hypothetical protein
MVAGTTFAIKGGLKLAEYLPLKISALTGGNITKTGKILGFSSKGAQYAEYFAKGSQYVAPVVLGGYGAYSFAGAAPYLYSEDPSIAREAERKLFVSFAAGTAGGKVGDYAGTEFSKVINPRVGYETIVQGGSVLGKLNKSERAFFEKAYKRGYGKELPEDIQVLFTPKKFTSKYLEIFENFTPKQRKAIVRITDKTINEFAKDLYFGGSLNLPTQTAGKFWKKSGDIDVFLGSKRFAKALEKNINTANIKGVTAKGSYTSTEAHVNLLKNGKMLNEQFANIHYDLSMTKGQLTKFGEPFQTTKGAFITTPQGYKLFNIREQLRGKLEGYYFAGREKDLIDISGIVKGTEKAAKLYKSMKTKDVLLDERAMFRPATQKQVNDKVGKISFKGVTQEAYSPYETYTVPAVVKYFVPKVDSYKEYIIPKNKNYITPYKTSYKSTYQVPYKTPYVDPYVTDYQVPYVPKTYGKYVPTNYPTPYPTEYKVTPNVPYPVKAYPKYKLANYPKPTKYPKQIYTPIKMTTYKQKKRIEELYSKKKRKAFSKKDIGRTILFTPSNISNTILPIKTDWLKAIGYTKKPTIQTIKLLPNERKGSKQVSRLLGFNFERLF